MFESEKKECSKILYNASRETWKNRKGLMGEVESLYDDFFGVRHSVLRGDNVVHLDLPTDGIGSKIEFAERLSHERGDFSPHRTIAHDLIAMVCDDAACQFQEPIVIANTIQTKKPNKNLTSELAKGLVEAAKIAKVSVLRGEYEVIDRVKGYGKFAYNWNASALSVSDKGMQVLGSPYHIELQFISDNVPKSFIVALKENGPRSNGYSNIRKALRKKYGKDWHKENYYGENIAETFLKPSTIYTPLLIDMWKGMLSDKGKVYGMAHITGGGIPEKLGRLLRCTPKKIAGAHLYDLFEPPDSLKFIQKISNMSDKAAYSIFNMGNGVLVVSPDPEYIMSRAKKYGVESKTVGQITKEPLIKIKSTGKFSKGETMKFGIYQEKFN